MKKLLPILCTIILISTDVKAQFGAEGYLDMGETLVSGGFYSQFSAIGSFEQEKWGVQGGAQLGLVQPQDVIFNSLYASPYAIINSALLFLFFRNCGIRVQGLWL